MNGKWRISLELGNGWHIGQSFLSQIHQFFNIKTSVPNINLGYNTWDLKWTFVVEKHVEVQWKGARLPARGRTCRTAASEIGRSHDSFKLRSVVIVVIAGSKGKEQFRRPLRPYENVHWPRHYPSTARMSHFQCYSLSLLDLVLESQRRPSRS